MCSSSEVYYYSLVKKPRSTSVARRCITAAYGALQGVPLLVESDPGQGKTSLAMAMGKAFQLPVLRVQFYTA